MRTIFNIDCTAVIHIRACADCLCLPCCERAENGARPSVDMQQMLAVQVALDRAGFSPGEIDGRGGPKTRLALSEFQKSASLQPTGVVNEETLARAARACGADRELHDHAAGCCRTVHRRDAGRHDGERQAAGAGVHVGARSARREISREPGVDANAQSRCGVGGRRNHQSAGRRAVRAADEGQSKAAATQPARSKSIDCPGATKSLVVRDAAEKILMHAPVTVGSSKDPLPVGDWKVTGVSWNPDVQLQPRSVLGCRSDARESEDSGRPE